MKRDEAEAYERLKELAEEVENVGRRSEKGVVATRAATGAGST